MLIIELDKKYHKFGKWKSHIQGKLYLRIILGWIAITYTEIHQKEMYRLIRNKDVFWII